MQMYIQNHHHPSPPPPPCCSFAPPLQLSCCSLAAFLLLPCCSLAVVLLLRAPGKRASRSHARQVYQLLVRSFLGSFGCILAWLPVVGCWGHHGRHPVLNILQTKPGQTSLQEAPCGLKQDVESPLQEIRTFSRRIYEGVLQRDAPPKNVDTPPQGAPHGFKQNEECPF